MDQLNDNGFYLLNQYTSFIIDQFQSGFSESGIQTFDLIRGEILHDFNFTKLNRATMHSHIVQLTFNNHFTPVTDHIFDVKLQMRDLIIKDKIYIPSPVHKDTFFIFRITMLWK